MTRRAAGRAILAGPNGGKMGCKFKGRIAADMNKCRVIALLLPPLIASTLSSVVGMSTKLQALQDFPRCLLFAGSCPAVQKKQHLLKYAVSTKRSTAPRSKYSMHQFNTDVLKELPFQSIFRKDKEDKSKSLATSKISDDELDENPAIESDCDWEYRDCVTRVIGSNIYPTFQLFLSL